MKKNERLQGARRTLNYPVVGPRKRFENWSITDDRQTEDEQVAEHEAAYRASDQTMIGVPTELVPEVRRLIARRRR